jgi:ATP-binding cassette, subfamily B, bacterial
VTSFVVFASPQRRPSAKAPKPSFRERVAALRYVPALLKLVWETHRGFTVAIAALRIVGAFAPIAALWVAKLIIDGVLAARAAGGDWRPLLPLVALEIGIVVAQEIISRITSIVEGMLGDLFSNRVSVRLMRHAATLDLAQFEDPTFYDHLERARQQTTARIGLINQTLGIAQNFITLGTMSAALLAFNPWLLLLLVLTVVPGFIGETHFAALGYSLLWRWTPQRRQLDYLRYVGASDRTAKEVQMFGLADWLIERYRTLSERFYDENRKLSIRRGLVSSALSLLRTGGYYTAYVVILVQAAQGTISIGSLTFLAATFQRGRDLVLQILMTASGVFEQSLYLRDLFMFFDMRPTITSPPNAPAVPSPIRMGFVFEDVGFRYPESERWAVRHLSFTLKAGERLALVGENGAGKTTITKLLARLYEPTEGRILLDGRDLREYDLASLRRAIGVIFQDFVRYDMRFDENIAVGEIAETRDYLDAQAPRPNGAPPEVAATAPAPPATDSEVPADIRTAADRSLAASLLPRLTRRYRQMLGRRFDDGVDLSGGEWQKVALARAYMRDAQVLILDEPTAALDARAEYEVFVRFADLMAGRTAVLISHRFSTVRMADRIVVLEHGEIVEQGTHDELVARDGLYGELFSLQAAGYR